MTDLCGLPIEYQGEMMGTGHSALVLFKGIDLLARFQGGGAERLEE